MPSRDRYQIVILDGNDPSRGIVIHDSSATLTDTQKGATMADEKTPDTNEDEFGEFTIVARVKPQPGVVQGEIPPALVKLLEENYKTALDSADQELILTAADAKRAEKLAGYAKAWGARQEPKLYIKKLPNGKMYPDTVARLSVQTWDKVPQDNRPGRRNGK